jgi:hypothetical protein
MDFKKRMEELLDKGIEGTKDLWDKAKEKAKDLSQRGMLTFEISQLERQARTELARLGSLVYDTLGKGNAFDAEDAQVKKVVGDLRALNAKIDGKEEELKKLKDKS